MLRYIEATHLGVKGFVIDEDNRPISNGRVGIQWTIKGPIQLNLLSCCFFRSWSREGPRRLGLATWESTGASSLRELTGEEDLRNTPHLILSSGLFSRLHAEASGYEPSEPLTVTVDDAIWPPRMQVKHFHLRRRGNARADDVLAN